MRELLSKYRQAGAAEIAAQWLRALGLILKDRGSILSIHLAAHDYLSLQFQASDILMQTCIKAKLSTDVKIKIKKNVKKNQTSKQN